MAKPKPRTEAEVDAEEELRKLAAQFMYDPYGFVCTFWAWGEGPLEGQTGPDVWQAKNLKEIGAKIRKAIADARAKGTDEIMAVLDAVAAANGVGKSAELSWIFWWLLCTHPDTVVIVTANTATQLLTKTQPEISKWGKLLICAHWWEITATRVRYIADPGHEDSWRADFIPWNKSNVSAFQGQHNFGKRLAFMIDEASGVATPIWKAIYGSLTDANTELFLIVRANPLEREGEFYSIFTGPARKRWNLTHVSGYESKATNKQQLDDWVQEYGKDSDFCLVRVFGRFPNASSLQFISSDVVQEARKRTVKAYLRQPLIIGCDPGDSGGDRTVIAFRRGDDARSIPAIKMPYDDTEGHLMQVAARCAEAYDKHGASMIFVDSGGIGRGVVARLKQMRYPVEGVGFGDDPLLCWSDLPEVPENRKAEIWLKLKYELPGLAIEDADELETDLTGTHSYINSNGERFMERKKDLKARGLDSPDWAEALALTYAAPVASVSRERGLASHPAAGAGVDRSRSGARVRDEDPWERFERERKERG